MIDTVLVLLICSGIGWFLGEYLFLRKEYNTLMERLKNLDRDLNSDIKRLRIRFGATDIAKDINAELEISGSYKFKAEKKQENDKNVVKHE